MRPSRASRISSYRCDRVSAEEDPLEYRQLGHSGVRVSTIGLGTNRFGADWHLTAEEMGEIAGLLL